MMQVVAMPGQRSPDGQTGTTVYYDSFKQRVGADAQSPKNQFRLRRNRPHPNTNFLLPSGINDGVELQKKVRKAVRDYLDELYYRQSESRESGYRAPPQFNLPANYEDFKQRVLIPKGAEKTYRPYPFYKEGSTTPSVAGKPTAAYEIQRPSTAILTEICPPSHLAGETKRDRNIRIRQEIDKKHRTVTPQPQPKKWQRIASALPTRGKPVKAVVVPAKKRAVSAPPAQGYSYYKQSTQKTPPANMFKPVQERLGAWAETASDYEKQVVYNMLHRAAKPQDGGPSTPPPSTEAYELLTRAKSYPAPVGEKAQKTTSWSPYFHGMRRQQQQYSKQRNLNSAPVKQMLGLVPNATQYPARDQRSYRLKGQDSRVAGNPEEDRELREYLSKMARVTQNQYKKPDKKFLIAPMHSFSPNTGSDKKDYKCDVSFFQSVRAPFKSHFVIHPDFTSENFTQKKRPSQMVSHFRY